MFKDVWYRIQEKSIGVQFFFFEFFKKGYFLIIFNYKQFFIIVDKIFVVRFSNWTEIGEAVQILQDFEFFVKFQLRYQLYGIFQTKLQLCMRIEVMQTFKGGNTYKILKFFFFHKMLVNSFKNSSKRLRRTIIWRWNC